MLPDRLAHLLADLGRGVQRGHGVLEDHRELLAAVFAHFLLRLFDDVLALIHYRALFDRCGRLVVEAHEGLYAYAAGNQQLVVAGIPEHATVWLYDALGKLIAMENTSHYMRTYTLPSSGVYFVRVNNEQGQRILRVIIK